MMLFWRQGYEATSLADLTAAIGIGQASLYAAFGSKEKLFLEALERYRSGVGSGLPRIMRNAATAREAMTLVLTGTAAAVTQRSQPRGCMIVLSALHGFTNSSDVDSQLRRCRIEDEKAIVARLQQGIAAGELPAGCSAKSMGAFFMAVLQGMSVKARDGVPRATLLEIAEQAMMAWPVTA